MGKTKLNRRIFTIGEELDPVYRGKGKKFLITGLQDDSNLKKIRVIKALEENGGLIAHAARDLECPYKVLRKYIEDNVSVKKALETIKTANVERAERKLRELVEGGHLGAICFTLKCQGRDRGWVENVDVNMPTVPIVFRYVNATPKAVEEKDVKPTK